MEKKHLKIGFISLLLFIVFGALVVTASSNTVFGDVKESAWYANDVYYTYEHAYMSGTANATFSPSSTMTRASVATLLCNMDDANTISYSSNVSFSDVPKTSWYHDAVEWAYACGIVKGSSNSTFSPKGTITRQDMCVMLYNYAMYCKFDTSATTLSGYKDTSSVSSYAKPAVSWAVNHGILTGTSDRYLQPKTSITRSQVAALICRFDKNVGHKWGVARVFTQRTCTQDGIYSYICSDCSKTRTATLKAWHTWYKESIYPASSGCQIIYHCKSNWNHSYTSIISHTWNSGVVVKSATCGASGSTKYTCTRCNGTFTATIPPTGNHSWSNGKVTKVATMSASGNRQYTCSKCNSTKNEAITPYYSNGAWYVKYKDTPILIANKTYALSSSYNPGGLTTKCQNAFNTMSNYMSSRGMHLYIKSGFRSYSTQVSTYNYWVGVYGKTQADRISARPGHSEHQSGLAIDVVNVNGAKLDENFINSTEGTWLSQNAHKYGFIIRYTKQGEAYTGYQYEPWHLRYIGSVELATEIYNSGLTLEQFLGIDSKYQ